MIPRHMCLAVSTIMQGNYMSAKEAFVSNMTGSSVGRLNLLSLVALVR
jgi:hypothetical protein